MGRANNERPRYSFKAQQIFRSVTGFHHRSFNILILVSKSFRLGTYLTATGGDRVQAVRLHTWNTAVSAAFYGPLQALENEPGIGRCLRTNMV